MSGIDRKARIREYKDTPRPAGVFVVRNTVEGRALLGSSPNLPGMLNRQRWDLVNGTHPSGELQEDWNRLGADAFEIEVIDELELSDDPTYNPADDLAQLKELWRDKMTAAGTVLYRELGRGVRGADG